MSSAYEDYDSYGGTSSGFSYDGGEPSSYSYGDDDDDDDEDYDSNGDDEGMHKLFSFSFIIEELICENQHKVSTFILTADESEEESDEEEKEGEEKKKAA